MCGIAGIISLNQKSSYHSFSIKAMTDQMVQRGPDDEGFALFGTDEVKTYGGADTPPWQPGFETIAGYPNAHIESAMSTPSMAALGHRRLSIVDLSPRGHQPMCTPDQRYWMVFNGEIYNYREIAQELRNLGVNLSGQSDSEVLLQAFVVWGEACLQKFNGMFAFAIWDNQQKTLFCARDRIGIKPFYYTIVGDNFIFGSDIKTLIASGYYKPELDIQGVYLAMAFGMAPRPKTAFKNVQALEQAHWLRISADGKIEKRRYWSIPIGRQNKSMSEGEAIELLEEQLTASIKRRLVADVPVGTFMSGGVDSTTVSAIAARLHPGIKAFTLGYENLAPEMDEVSQAIATARLHPMEHIIHRVDPVDSLVDLDRWIEGYEEPFHGLAANHVISKIVKENNVKVVLNGLGGDELFAGYGWYSRISTWKMLRAMRPLGKMAAPFMGDRKEKLMSLIDTKTADRLHSVLFSQFSDAHLRQLFNSDPELANLDSAEYVHQAYADGLEFTDDIEAFNYMDLTNYIGNHHVHRSDQFTMMHSIEGRFPFLDHELVEAAFTIPSHLKRNGKINKYVLRKVAEKYIAPECLNMTKKGFGLPLKQWMKGPLANIVENEISDLAKLPFIEASTVDDWYSSYQKGQFNYQKVWHLSALSLWYKRFMGNGNP